MGRLIWFSQILCLSLLLLHFQVECSSLSPNSPPHLCRPQEHFALLDFNTTISAGNCDFCRRTIQTWNESVDCCLWEGVTCSKMTGHVVGLDLSDSCIAANLTTNSSLFRLEKLQSLNFAHNDLSYPNSSFGFHIWKSLTYLNLTGTKIFHNSILFEISWLPKLVSLDLSHNYDLQLQSTTFQMLVHNLTELRFLILDSMNMSLVVPSSLLNLTSSLKHLSLSCCNLQGNFPNQVFQLPSLQLLDLSYNFHLGGNLPESNWSSHLEYLNLRDTNFSGELSHSIENLKLLKELKLYDCQFYGSIPRSLTNLTEITQLDFSSNHLQGQIPDVFGKMHKLTYLSFAANNFGGEIPASILNLTHLTFWSLSSNNLTGSLPHNISGLTFLQELLMDNNLIIGRIPPWLFSLPSLHYLDLRNNILTGPIDHIETPNLSLQEVNLSNNEISGSIPYSFFDLMSLRIINLFSNNLRGTITPNMLSKFVYLEYLDLSNNRLLSLSNNSIGVNYSFPNLWYLRFSGCNIDKFPSFFRKAERLLYLDISKNKISGQICKWEMEGMSLDRLDLSYNFLTGIDLFAFKHLASVDLSGNDLTGKIPPWYCNLTFLSILDLANNSLEGKIPECFGNFSSLSILDLRMNKLEGRLPPLGYCSLLEVIDVGNNYLRYTFPHWLGALPKLQVLILQENNLTGEIPSSLCNLSSLTVLDLAKNSLEGEIPECLGMFSQLSVMDLRMNKFLGRIPNSFVSNTRLRTLDLNSNQLEGRLPRSLVNCSFLEVLDVGNNYLNDTFPHWLSVLPSLQVLILQSNQFHGFINNSMTALPSFSQLRIIDISQNQFDGLLPTKYFQSFKAMRDVYQDESYSKYIGDSLNYYEDSVKLVIKGLEVELVRILKIFTSIDFSSNQFHGPIPEEIGELNSLLLLNLSHNSLTGQIPSSFGKLAELESLDLSSNKLEGRIPEQWTNLTFLSVLNLSQNDLVGQIPEGKQFNTFSNDSYIGNSRLCGFPLIKKCQLGAPASKFDEEEDDSATLFEWKFALAGYGFGLVLGLNLGYIAFTTGKPWWVVKKVEKYQQKFVRRCNGRHKKRKIQKPNQRS